MCIRLEFQRILINVCNKKYIYMNCETDFETVKRESSELNLCLSKQSRGFASGDIRIPAERARVAIGERRLQLEKQVLC